QRQPERLRLAGDVEPDLRLAAAERVGDVDHAGVLGELRLDALGGLLQAVEVAAGELDVDRLAAAEQIGGEGELDDVGDGGRALAPAADDLAGRRRAFLGRNQLDVDLAHVRA